MCYRDILIKIKSENSTFVFKSPKKNKKPCRQKLLSDKQIKFKEFCCPEINFIKICPEIALTYFCENMWFYMKYSKKSKVTNTYVHVLYLFRHDITEILLIVALSTINQQLFVQSLKLWVRIPLMSRRNRYNIIWYYMIKCVSDLRKVGGFLPFSPPIKLPDRHDITAWPPRYNCLTATI